MDASLKDRPSPNEAQKTKDVSTNLCNFVTTEIRIVEYT